MNASSAAARVASAVAAAALAARTGGAQGPVQLSSTPIAGESELEELRGRHGRATAEAGPHQRDDGRRHQRRRSRRSLEGPGQADLLGQRPGADDHPRLRPRGRRPAVLHLERGHAGGHRDVSDAARRLQRGARVPVDARRRDAGACRAGRATPTSRSRSVDQLHRRRHDPGRVGDGEDHRGRDAVAHSTTLFAPAAAGDTNVKVAATTGLAAGDALRVGDQTVTITNVGTQGRATTLAAAAAAGATNIKVASVTGLVANSTITVGGQTRTIATVGTQGANGTGLTLPSRSPGRRQRRGRCATTARASRSRPR